MHLTTLPPAIDPPVARNSAQAYELRFESVFNAGRGWSFPCDSQGRVDLDRMSERARRNYFFVRTVVGREVTPPQVRMVW